MKDVIENEIKVDKNYKDRFFKIYVKLKKAILFLLREAFNFGVGWGFGILSVQLVMTFFEEKGMMNLWGLWSDKIVVEESTLSTIQWLTSAIVGYIVMTLINNLIAKVKSYFIDEKLADD